MRICTCIYDIYPKKKKETKKRKEEREGVDELNGWMGLYGGFLMGLLKKEG